MAPSTPEKDVYLIEAVARACDLLAAFRNENETVRLKDLVQRTGLNTTTAYRLLYTLEKKGLVDRVREREYRARFRPYARGRYRFGYASQGEDATFAQEWSVSIQQACAEHGIDLMVLDNGFDPEAAIRNVDRFIEAKVDIAIEHQFNDQIAPILSAKLHEAGIPLIAMGTAHAGAVYFGGNNYAAGLLAGRQLGRYARQHWGGAVDELILLKMLMGGTLIESRLRGVEAGVREILPALAASKVRTIKGSGQFGDTMDLMRKYLRRTGSRKFLVCGVNDPCALGALRAFEEAGWSEDCAVAGQGGSLEGRSELRRPGTRFIGTVAFFPERYGENILRIAMDILRHKPVPPAVFVKHQFLTPANVDHYYANDVLLNASAAEARSAPAQVKE